MEKYVQANFEIEENKKELVKAIANRKGMSFKDFLNYAIDIAIKGETKEKSDLLQDKKILEKELKTIEDKYEKDKAAIENKLKEINITLENVTVEHEEKSENDNYNKLVNMACSPGNRIEDIEDLINDHARTYNLNVDELIFNIRKDVEYRKFKR